MAFLNDHENKIDNFNLIHRAFKTSGPVEINQVAHLDGFHARLLFAYTKGEGGCSGWHSLVH